jgi:prolyl-tRNA synthetase
VEPLLPIEKVATPETKTIEDLANFLGVPKAKTAKAVFLVGTIPEGKNLTQRFIFAVVRGDMEVNETKLAHAVNARELRPATEEEIRSTGAVPGYASPAGLGIAGGTSPMGVMVVVDDIILQSPNLVAGANEEGFHLRNVNFGRDYRAGVVADIVAAQEGNACARCGNPLHTMRGVEVANIFQLGTRYSDVMQVNYLDAEGQLKPVVMGSYGIGSGRLLACIAENYHDEHGLIWPVTVAPCQVHLVALPGKGREAEILSTAGQLYEDMKAAGVEVLFDDRAESPGVKFNDADLIGLPIRITVSERSLKQGGVEFKRRDQAERCIFSIEEILPKVKREIVALLAAIDSSVVPVPYEG